MKLYVCVCVYPKMVYIKTPICIEKKSMKKILIYLNFY